MPNRLIKASIHDSEKVNQMTDFQFRVWVNLITYVDDYGRGDARPAIIKGNCFPLRERLTAKDIEAALKALAGIGCINLYSVDGKSYLCFPNWESHQTVRNAKSKFPAPGEASSGACAQLNAIECNCMQANANVPVIQSNPNPNPNPNTESERARDPVIGIDGSDLSQSIFRNRQVDALVNRYRLSSDDVTREKLLEDLEQYGEARVHDALEKAAEGNTKDRISPNYWRAILANKGSPKKDFATRNYSKDDYNSVVIDLSQLPGDAG